MLKSKLLIGEFVILSQNYSHSPAQRSLLAERIVKLVSRTEEAGSLAQTQQSKAKQRKVKLTKPNSTHPPPLRWTKCFLPPTCEGSTRAWRSPTSGESMSSRQVASWQRVSPN